MSICLMNNYINKNILIRNLSLFSTNSNKISFSIILMFYLKNN